MSTQSDEWFTVPSTKKTKKPRKSDSEPIINLPRSSDYQTNEPQDYNPMYDTKVVYLGKKSDFTPKPKFTPQRQEAIRLAKIDSGEKQVESVGLSRGRQISSARNSKNLSQIQLAQQLSIPVSLVKEWENGTGVYIPKTWMMFQNFINSK